MWYFKEEDYEDTIAESKLGEFFPVTPTRLSYGKRFRTHWMLLMILSSRYELLCPSGVDSLTNFRKPMKT